MNAPRVSLDDYLRSLPGRCTGCGHHLELQGCACAGLAAKDRGQAIASNAHPDDRARVDAAIRTLAATGRPFSANDARRIHGVKGGVVGAAFGALKNAGVIRPYTDDGLVRSTSGPTHGHHIFQWIGAAA